MIQYDIKKHVNCDIIDGVVNYVIYSHSSFLDVLNIQLDYIQGKGHLTLFIDENNHDLKHIYNKFDKVVFYDSNLTYGNKMLNCLNQIDYEYFIFIHDNDILYYVDNQKMLEFIDFLKINNYDRVDFQLAYDFNRELSHTIEDDGLYLIKSSNTDTTANGYIYNVNPSIWKLETLKKIMQTYSHRDYRTIEHPEVQEFCLQFNIFKLYSKQQYNCGYFICLEPFKYLHITHSQHYLNLGSLPKESYKDIEEEYTIITNKYNLKNSNKWIH